VADAVSIRERALTADKSDRQSNASETAAGRLGVWTLLDTGLRVGEPCGLTPGMSSGTSASSGSKTRARDWIRTGRSVKMSEGSRPLFNYRRDTLRNSAVTRILIGMADTVPVEAWVQ
jgi:hypothetical protein